MSFIVRSSRLHVTQEQQQLSTDTCDTTRRSPSPVCMEFPDAIEQVHYPNYDLIRRRSSSDSAIETSTRSLSTSSSSTCSNSSFVQATLVLLPARDKKKNLWNKTKAAFGYTPPDYEIIFLQEPEEKAPTCYTLYSGNDASAAMSAFDDLNNTLTPLMRDGSVLLNEALLREIILPKPLPASQISFHLVEVMEADPRTHPDWHKVLQVLLHSACSREDRNEIKFLLEKGGDLGQQDNEGNTPIHTAAVHASKESMNWLLSVAAPSTPIDILIRRNSDGLSPIDVAKGSKNIGAARALMMKQAVPSSKSMLDLYENDLTNLELHEAVDENNCEQIWKYCEKVGLVSVHVRGRREAVSLKRCPLKKQKTVDVCSKSGLTPLMLAIEKQYVKSTLLLLLGGADPDQHHPVTGDTPLHYAVRVGNLTLIKALLVFGADPLLSNEDGTTSLKLSKDLKKSDKITQTLEEITKLQEKTWNYFVSHFEMPEQKTEEETYLLAMDGGGVRSFNTCQAYLAIEDRMKQLNPRCKPFCSYFDYVAGTSAGGVTALIANYTDAPSSVSRALIYKTVTEVFALPKSERANLMDKYLKDMLGEDTTMSDSTEQRVIITSTLADRNPSKLHLMTNYGEARDGQAGPTVRKVWEAAKATSAAPYFFPTFQGKFLDGGLMANNPTLDAMVEIHAQAEKENKEVKIGCVVSLGTGYAPVKSVDNIDVFIPGLNFKTIYSIQETLSGLQSLLDLFVTQVTQSDGQEVMRAKSWCKSLGTPYFRLSPPLQEEIDPLSVDDEAIINMLYEAEKYILDQPEVIDSIAKCLLTKKMH